ncbi:hypothetical protein E5D57_004517 [Metarhizium anisopliae]|nr:hypothetical protein E5D57_004517 [Metarhizium anisopliae]
MEEPVKLGDRWPPANSARMSTKTRLSVYSESQIRPRRSRTGMRPVRLVRLKLSYNTSFSVAMETGIEQLVAA